jgi:PAS domain S-box-containing protein
MGDANRSTGAGGTAPSGNPVFEQSEWLQVTLSCIGDGVITADQDGLVTFLNPVAETLTGWALADAAGRKVEEVFCIVSEATRELVEQPVRTVFERGTVAGLVSHTVLIGKDGTERFIDDSAAPIKNAQGDILGVVLIFRDITDRRRIEKATENAKRYAEAIVETVREPLLILDSDLKVRSANRAFYQTFHVEKKETEGRVIYELGNRQWDIPELRTLIGDILPRHSSFENFQVEQTFEHIGPRTMMLNAHRFDDADSNLELILLAIEDVTVRRQAEEALQDADRRKNEFLATLSHELRNPLSAIAYAVEIVSRADMEDQRTWAAEMVKRQVHQLTRLVDDLLDVSRISEGKIRLQKEPVELHSVLNRAAAVVRPLVDEMGHELSISPPRGPMRLEADPSRLEQVFVNLLTNAAKYTEPGGRIELSGRREGNELVVSVRDTGVGIAPEMLPGVFDMFKQIDSSIERSRGGLGIGLVLVKQLTELHGGSVSVVSEGVGKGSEFSLRLPAAN